MLAPQPVLMQLCAAPALQPTVTVRAMQANLLAYRGAYEACDARMRCLVDWLRSAQAGKTVVDCRAGKAP